MQQKKTKLPLFVRKPFLVVYFAFVLSCLTAVSILAVAHPADAANPTLNFQARLLTPSGAVVPDGNYNVEFKIYSGASCNPSSGSNCAADWTEDYYGGTTDNRLRVSDGYLTVNLGSLTAFNASIPWGQQLWLSINIGGTTNTGTPTLDGAMFPYITMTSVPAAMALNYTDGTHTGSLAFTPSLTGNDSITLPDASGTVCLQSSANCGFAPATGSTGYIQLQGSTPGASQTGNFNIGGIGTVGGLVLQGSTAYIINSQGYAGSEAFGNGASVSEANATALGDGSSSGLYGVAVGKGSTALADSVAVGYGTSAAQYSVAVGSGANTSSYYSVAVGQNATANEYGVAIGYGASASSTYSIAIGQNATATASDQLVAIAQYVYFGNGVQNSTPANASINATGGSGSNANGATLYLDGGAGTGSASGGSVDFRVTASGGTSGSTPNTLTTVAGINGGTGSAFFQNAVDSASGFQVQNVAGQDLIQVDTANNNIVLGGNESGALQPWATNGTTIPTGSYAPVTAVSNGYVYYVGGYTGSSSLSSVNYATLNANGSVGSWTTSSNSLPVALSDSVGFANNGYLYVIGGSTNNSPGGAVSSVYYAKLNSDGSVGSWHTNSNPLPDFISFGSGTVSNGYVYVVGGVDNSTRLNTTYYAHINADGSIGSWTASSHNLPTAIDAGAVVTVNGYLYYIGGYTGSSLSGEAYYAHINADGSIGSWSTDSHTMPNWVSSPGLSVANGYIYVIAGAGSGFNENTVQFAPLTTSGALGANWTVDTNTLPATVAGMDSVVTNNGYIYYLGGTTNNAGTSTTNTIYYSSTERVQLGGSLDLVGLGNQALTSPGSISNGSSAGSITAGNITAVGMLQVQGAATFSQSLATDGSLTVGGDAAFQAASNSSTAFEVQNSSGVNLFNVDTSGNVVNIGATGSTALASTINIGTSNSSGNAQTVNIGSNGDTSNAVTIDAGTGSSAIQIGNSSTDHGIQIGTGAGNETVTVGSTNSDSTTQIQGGTGGISFLTGSGSSTTGSISITTGANSAGASGSITIDAGSNVPTGTQIADKTFESDLENMGDSYGYTDTLTDSTAQAHLGTKSLAITAGSTPGWSVGENTPFVISVTAGDSYTFTAWARAGTVPSTITGAVTFSNCGYYGGCDVGDANWATVTDTTTGWTKMTGTVVAPAGALNLAVGFNGTDTASGQINYIDDVAVTDTTVTDTPSINIGTTNAQAITIGNSNQNGATLIQGGADGVSINAGANANINIGTTNAGTVNIGSVGSSTSTSTINIATSTGASQTVHIADGGTEVSTVTVGSANDTSATTLQAGSGGLSLVTGAASGNTGGVVIQSGSSSGGVSGNVVIDTGASSVVSGSGLESDGFESGSVDNWQAWFGVDSVASSSAEHHSGSDSLTATTSADNGGWALQADHGYPGVSVEPGLPYKLSVWVKGTVSEAVDLSITWNGGSGGFNTLDTETISTTGWTELSGTITAPAGITNLVPIVHGNDTGSTIYVDDFLLSGSAAPSIAIGGTNAAAVLLGNQGEAGATTIQSGGGGIKLNAVSGSVIIGSGNVGETNGQLLVLDSDTDATFSDGTTSNAPSEVDGAMFFSSTNQDFMCGVSGSWETCNGLLYSNTSAGSNVASCTTSCGSLAQAAIPANYCQAGRVINIKASGVYTTSSTTIQFGLYYGSSSTSSSDTLLGGSGGTLTQQSSSVSASSWTWQLYYTVTCFSSTSMMLQGYEVLQQAAAAAGTSTEIYALPISSTTTVDTSGNNSIYIFPVFGANAAGNNATMEQYVVTGN